MTVVRTDKWDNCRLKRSIQDIYTINNTFYYFVSEVTLFGYLLNKQMITQRITTKSLEFGLEKKISPAD